MSKYQIQDPEARARLDEIDRIMNRTAVEAEKTRKEIEGLLQSFKKTRKEVNDMNKSSEEVKKQLAETGRKVAETTANIDKYLAEQKKHRTEIGDINKSSEEVKKQLAETGKKVAETTANIDKYLAEVKESRKEIGGLGKSLGMFAESYFSESLKKSKQFGGITYDHVEDDLNNTILMPNGVRIDAQFDIVMTNGDSVAIIEVKSKVQKDDVKDLVGKKLDSFKKIYQQYANYKFYLGVAGLSFDKNAEQEAIKTGVAILKLSGENIEIQDNHLIVYW